MSLNRFNIFLCALTCCLGFLLFQLKYRVVIPLEQELISINSSIRKCQASIHVLEAEWSRLNAPQDLQRRAKKYLLIAPIMAHQIVAWRDIPFTKKSPTVNETVDVSDDSEISLPDRLFNQLGED